MTNIVIVAIPEDNDPIWDFSSEKKPHMTLLYIQKPLDVDTEGIVQYVKHAADVCLNRFGLSIDRRGTLGEDGADVLFMDQTHPSIKELRTFRSHLIRDDTISKYYQKAEQFPGWIPHVTVGYPDSPAKDEKYERMYMYFDRIGVWINDEDYSGPEFFLKDHPGIDQGEISQAEEDLGGPTHESDDSLDEVLAHFGVKGMRWGVRRPTGSDGLIKGSKAKGDSDGSDDSESSGSSSKSSSDHKNLVENLDKEISELSTNEVREIANRIRAIKDLEGILGRPTPNDTDSDGSSSNKKRIDDQLSDHETLVRALKGDPANLSTAQLQAVNNRAKALKELKTLSDQQKEAKRSMVSKMLRWASSSMFSGAKTGAEKVLRKTAENLIEDMLGEYMPKTSSRKAKEAADKLFDNSKKVNEARQRNAKTRKDEADADRARAKADRAQAKNRSSGSSKKKNKSSRNSGNSSKTKSPTVSDLIEAMENGDGSFDITSLRKGG